MLAALEESLINKRPASLWLNFLKVFSQDQHTESVVQRKPRQNVGKNLPHGTGFGFMKGPWSAAENCQWVRPRENTESLASVAVETLGQKGSWRQAAVLHQRRHIGESVASVAVETSEY